MGTEQYVLPFDLSPLPKLLNNDMIISSTGAVSGSIRRRARDENPVHTCRDQLAGSLVIIIMTGCI